MAIHVSSTLNILALVLITVIDLCVAPVPSRIVVENERFQSGGQSVSNRQLSPNRRPILGRGFLTSQTDRVVKVAVHVFSGEEHVLQHRQQDGVDVAVPDFPDIAPNILGAAKGTTETSLSKLTLSCRVMNWVAAISKAEKVRRPLSTFMNSFAARQARLTCPFVPPKCNPYAPYRSLDGSCNNLRHPLWGSSFIPFKRDLPAIYGTGKVGEILRNDLIRNKGTSNAALPNPRVVSNIVHSSSDIQKETEVNMLYTNYGQSLSHDLTDTPMEGGFEGTKLNCCNQTIPTQRCGEIYVPNNDFFNQFGRKCINFVRSVEVTDINCRTGVREQLNIATSYVDGTQLYGKNKAESDSVREKRDGLLKTSSGNQCPFQQHPNKKGFELGLNAFKAGDEKLSESTGLLAVTLVWYREHNRIAKKLAEFKKFKMLPEKVRDDFIFEETRKIVIAMMQHVTYSEYLPVTVGPDAMHKYDLWPLKDRYYQGYSESTDPTLTNAFATATMRFGHSMIRDDFSVLKEDYSQSSTTLRLKETFWRSNFFLMYENGFQRGTATDKSEVCDRHMGVDIRNHLFQTREGNGADLASFNIQRGRDHGLPSYGDFRRTVSLNYPTQWSRDPKNGLPDMSHDTIAKFRKVYQSPEDIDLWSAGISEIPVKGGQVGRLFSELLGRQFSRLRTGDRYWHENEATGFSAAKLAEIRKVTMARLMCNSVVGIETIQRKAFLAPTNGGDNDRVPCSSISSLNLDLWK